MIAPWVTPTHAAPARWNCVERGSNPAALIICCEMSPLRLGSGKPDRPWLRRQCAKASSTCRCACCSAGVESVGPGRMPRHALEAALNAGAVAADFGAIMLTATPFPVVVTCGSGKLETPWARMHRAYAYAWAPGLCAAALFVMLVVGWADPQPAATAIRPRAGSARTISRREIMGRKLVILRVLDSGR